MIVGLLTKLRHGKRGRTSDGPEDAWQPERRHAAHFQQQANTAEIGISQRPACPELTAKSVRHAAMDWLTVPLVRDQLAMARRDWDAISFPAAECWPIQRAIETGSFESPIEAVFAMWWRMYECVMVGEWEGSVVLRPQHDVTIDGEAFRLDFAVIARDPLIQQLAERFNRSIRIAIELDGHEFHERTKAQVARRNYRDRVLQLAGWTVLHVSGSELIRLQADAVRPLFVLAGKTYREMSAQLSADLQQVI